MYRTNAGLKALAAQHPDNKLLTGRGPPGTHDVDLARKVLHDVCVINESSKETVHLPIFDKSLVNGEGDRSSETVDVTGPLDVFILEGWSMGFFPLSFNDLETRYQSATSQTSYFSQHSLDALKTLNTYLHEFAEAVYPSFDAFVQIEPTSYEYVFKWRLEQEHHMKAKNGGRGMDDDAVRRFVERYMPGYELWKEGIWASDRPWAGKGLRMFFGPDREIIGILQPQAKQSLPMTASKTPQKGEVGSSKPAVKASAESPRKPGKYSRNFLTAHSALQPAYDFVPPVNSLHQDSTLLEVTTELAVFPMQGPGGRLGVHSLSKRGRMQDVPYLSAHVDVIGFAVDPFGANEASKIAIAGEDGQVLVYQVSHTELADDERGPRLTLKGASVMR